MKNFGPNSPRTVRGLLERRKPRGVMDTRWHQEADIVTAPMSSPFGKGFHELKSPAGTRYLVADQTGGRTFAPDTEVMVAVPQGLHNKAVLGGAPSNKKGGTARTRSSRRRGTVVLGANQYAFGIDGLGNMVATLYSDGTYVSTRATEVEVAGSYTGCILTDSSAVVGDGSLLMRGASGLYVWDVEGAATYSYSAPGGWLILTAPYYQNGLLYWVECEDFPDLTTVDFDVRLRSAATDLTGASTITTTNLTIAAAQSDLGGSVIEYFEYSGGVPDVGAGILVDEDGAVVYFFCRPQDGNGERTDYWNLQFRFALSGGAPSYRLWSAPEGTEFSGVTIGVTSFAFFISRADLGYIPAVMSKADNSSAAAADYWDTSTLETSGASSISIGTGGSVIQIHSSAASGYLIRGVASGTVITSSIEAFDGTNYPTAMYYFGE